MKALSAMDLNILFGWYMENLMIQSDAEKKNISITINDEEGTSGSPGISFIPFLSVLQAVGSRMGITLKALTTQGHTSMSLNIVGDSSSYRLRNDVENQSQSLDQSNPAPTPLEMINMSEGDLTRLYELKRKSGRMGIELSDWLICIMDMELDYRFYNPRTDHKDLRDYVSFYAPSYYLHLLTTMQRIFLLTPTPYFLFEKVNEPLLDDNYIKAQTPPMPNISLESGSPIMSPTHFDGYTSGIEVDVESVSDGDAEDEDVFAGDSKLDAVKAYTKFERGVLGTLPKARADSEGGFNTKCDQDRCKTSTRIRNLSSDDGTQEARTPISPASKSYRVFDEDALDSDRQTHTFVGYGELPISTGSRGYPASGSKPKPPAMMRRSSVFFDH